MAKSSYEKLLEKNYRRTQLPEDESSQPEQSSQLIQKPPSQLVTTIDYQMISRTSLNLFPISLSRLVWKVKCNIE